MPQVIFNYMKEELMNIEVLEESDEMKEKKRKRNLRKVRVKRFIG